MNTNTFYGLMFVAVAFMGIHFYNATSQSSGFPAPVKKIFEAQDGLHVIYKANDRFEDILIELEDEQDVYQFDINGKVYAIQIIRHCTIGDCNAVDVAFEGKMYCVSSYVKRVNQDNH